MKNLIRGAVRQGLSLDLTDRAAFRFFFSDYLLPYELNDSLVLAGGPQADCEAVAAHTGVSPIKLDQLDTLTNRPVLGLGACG